MNNSRLIKESFKVAIFCHRINSLFLGISVKSFIEDNRSQTKDLNS